MVRAAAAAAYLEVVGNVVVVLAGARGTAAEEPGLVVVDGIAGLGLVGGGRLRVVVLIRVLGRRLGILGVGGHDW